MSELEQKIQKALEYAELGDPIRDVICGDAEWAEVLIYLTAAKDAAEAELAIVTLHRDQLLEENRGTFIKELAESTLQARVAVLKEAMEKLACLDNGDSWGNSIGNEIAQKALTAAGFTDVGV